MPAAVRTEVIASGMPAGSRTSCVELQQVILRGRSTVPYGAQIETPNVLEIIDHFSRYMI